MVQGSREEALVLSDLVISFLAMYSREAGPKTKCKDADCNGVYDGGGRQRDREGLPVPQKGYIDLCHQES